MKSDAMEVRVRSWPREIHRQDCACESCALARLTKAARIVAAILDAGKRDPRWSETEALETAAIAYGRAVTAAKRITPAPRGMEIDDE